MLSFAFFTLINYTLDDIKNLEKAENHLTIKTLQNEGEHGSGLRFSKQSFGERVQEGYETFGPIRENTQSSTTEILIKGLTGSSETPVAFSSQAVNAKNLLYERTMSREDENYEIEKRNIPMNFVEERLNTKQTSGIFTPKTQGFSESEISLVQRQGKPDYEPMSQVLSETTRSSPRRNKQEFYDQGLSRGQTNLAEELLNENNKGGNEGQTVRIRREAQSQEFINSSQRPELNPMKSLQIPPKGTVTNIHSVSTTRGNKPIGQEVGDTTSRKFQEEWTTPRTGKISQQNVHEQELMNNQQNNYPQNNSSSHKRTGSIRKQSGLIKDMQVRSMDLNTSESLQFDPNVRSFQDERGLTTPSSQYKSGWNRENNDRFTSPSEDSFHQQNYPHQKQKPNVYTELRKVTGGVVEQLSWKSLE